MVNVSWLKFCSWAYFRQPDCLLPFMGMDYAYQHPAERGSTVPICWQYCHGDVKKGALGQVSLTSTLPATIILLFITMNPYFNQTFSGLGRHLFYAIIIACLIALGSLHLFSSKSFTRLPELKNGNFLISLLLPIFFSISYWSLFVTLSDTSR